MIRNFSLAIKKPDNRLIVSKQMMKRILWKQKTAFKQAILWRIEDTIITHTLSESCILPWMHYLWENLTLFHGRNTKMENFQLNFDEVIEMKENGKFLGSPGRDPGTRDTMNWKWNSFDFFNSWKKKSVVANDVSHSEYIRSEPLKVFSM